MLHNYFAKKLLAFSFFILFICFGFSQTPKQTKEITKKYNLEKLNELGTSFEETYLKEQSIALQLAKQNGWPITFTDDNGTFHQLRKVINGKPIYYQTYNVNAAISTRANYLHNGGGLGLDLEGQGMTAHIWDAGVARSTHQEYDGTGGSNRFSLGDGNATLNFHSAHVTGTIIASGVNAGAKGMAPQANAVGYNWGNDTNEAANAAASGMLLSNHSYGAVFTDLTGTNDWIIGAYIQDSKDWDDLMFNAPYYLMVVAAGNDGNDNATNTSPLNGNAAYDKLSFFTTSKNGLVVANGQDATINGDGSLNSVVRNFSSSEGPTDDLRIKPDIMGNGTGLFSTFETNDAAYASISGTSMASPNVCGSLLLLQQHYNNTNGVFMRASTLKGLALHTADDTEGTGPDAHTGWGLLNTKAAAETITNNGTQSWVSEEELTDGDTFTMDVLSDGISPLLASISWTDQGGQISTGILNDGTPVLVNDLDIRVTQTSSTFLPWKLTGVNTNEQGDNIVDPFERVDVTGASDTYTITVTHKGTLVGGSQKFSLIATGLTSNFTFSTQNPDKTECFADEVVYNFNYMQTEGATTNFSTSGEPAGMTTNISPASLNTNGIFNVTFGNLLAVPAGTYNIDVIGDDGIETEAKTVSLRVIHGNITPIQILTSPANGSTGMPSTLSLTWQNNFTAESFLIEVSTNPSFSPIIYSSTETNLFFDLNGLMNETVYYWRVKPNYRCNDGVYSETFSFQVGSISCGTNIFTATDFSDGNILTTAGDLASAPVMVSTGGLNLDMIETSFEINHTWVNDIKISLEGPPAIGSPQVLLFESSCNIDNGGDENPGDGDNFNVSYSDLGVALFCDDVAVPSIVGTVKPLENLSSFSGLTADGVWTLRIVDPNDGDGGDITAFSIDICTLSNIASLPNFNNNGFVAPLNATYTFLSTDIEATSAAETAAQQIYTVVVLPTVGDLEKNAAAMAVGDTYTQDDVNTGKITYTNTETGAYADQFKVDIQNAANGWLSNQIITLNGTLSVSEFELGNLTVWPNPASEVINIKLNNISNNSDVFVNLFDIQGRTIQKVSYKTNSNTFIKTLDLNSVQNGIYLLEIKQGNKKATKKIIINY